MIRYKMLPPEQLIFLSKCLGQREDINKFCSIIEEENYKTLLDCGCGTGYTTLLLAERNFRITAIDIDKELINYAKENNKHQNIEYVVADFRNPPFNERFDIISFFWNSIAGLRYHEKYNLIKNLRKNISSGGIIFIDSEKHPFSNSEFIIDKNVKIKTFGNGRSIIFTNIKDTKKSIEYWFHSRQEWEDLFSTNNFYGLKFEEYMINNNRRIAIAAKYKNE